MTLVRRDQFAWDPFRELEEMNARFGRILGRDAARRASTEETLSVPDWAPAVDVAETPEAYVIKADLPDVQKDDVKVTVEHNILRIVGERRQEKEEHGKRFHRVERSYGSFVRAFSVPENVDDARVAAEFKNGVLTVKLPKTEKAKPKSIAVEVR